MHPQLQEYLDRGIFIVPARGKVPVTPSGFKDASNDPVQVEKWLKQYPGCNWGINFALSGLCALDVDVYKGVAVQDVENAIAGCITRNTPTVKTGKNAPQIYFKHPGLESLAPRLSLIKGVDFLTNFGIAPPSIHPETGKPYVWEVGLEVPFADLPKELLDFVLKKQAPAPSLQGFNPESGDLYLGAGDGRWNWLRVYAGRLRAWGWGEEAIFAGLKAFYDTQVEPYPGDYDRKLLALTQFVCRQPAKNTKEKDETVLIQTPDGSIGKIPIGALDEALRLGAQRVYEGEQ